MLRPLLRLKLKWLTFGQELDKSWTVFQAAQRDFGDAVPQAQRKTSTTAEETRPSSTMPMAPSIAVLDDADVNRVASTSTGSSDPSSSQSGTHRYSFHDFKDSNPPFLLTSSQPCKVIFQNQLNMLRGTSTQHRYAQICFLKYKGVSHAQAEEYTHKSEALQRETVKKCLEMSWRSAEWLAWIQKEVASRNGSLEGGQWQTTITKGLEDLANGKAPTCLKGTVGEDWDYCEYLHNGTSFNMSRSISEVIVKSFSPTSHIHKLAFQLLSIIGPAADRGTRKFFFIIHVFFLTKGSSLLDTRARRSRCSVFLSCSMSNISGDFVVQNLKDYFHWSCPEVKYCQHPEVLWH